MISSKMKKKLEKLEEEEKPEEGKKKESAVCESNESPVVRKIVDGKLYDTSKAEKLATYGMTDGMAETLGIEYWTLMTSYTLYCTQKGNFFVACYCNITPVDESMAKKILSDHPDEYIKIFGEVEEA